MKISTLLIVICSYSAMAITACNDVKPDKEPGKNTATEFIRVFQSVAK